MEKLSKYYLEILKLLAAGEKDSRELLITNYKSALVDIKKVLKDYLNRYGELTFQEWLKIDRLKSLQEQINIILDNIYGVNESIIVNHAKESYSLAYNGLFYQLEVEEGIILDFTMIDNDYVKKAIQMPIEGLRLSERLYDKHLNNLKLKVKGAITKGLIDGSGYINIAKDISDIGAADFKQAFTIAVTEGGRLKSLGREDSNKEAAKRGVDLQKRWLSTLDKKTRHSHQKLDGQTIPIDGEFEINGRKAPQPRLFGIAKEDIRCRCDTITIVEGIDPSLRRDNETGEVTNFKNYAEWKQDKINKIGKERYEIEEKKVKNTSSDKKQYARYKEILGNRAPKTLEEFQELKYNNVNEWNIKQREYNTISDINSKEWSDIYKEKVKTAYYNFRKDSIELSWHGGQRFVDRNLDKKGNITFTQKDIVDMFNAKPNYIQQDGRLVNFNNGIAIIRNSETNEIVSIVVRRNPKEDWIKND